MGNTFGKIFKLTTFGESHGEAIGGVIDGCPSGLELDIKKVQNQLDRRRPGQSKITTQRKENDNVEFLSGIFEGKTTGTPIGFLIRNQDQKSKDYSHLKDSFRPSHGDFTYQKKYGIRDYRGGGRSSARETASRVVAGSIAQQILDKLGVKILAYVSAVGSVKMTSSYQDLDLTKIENNLVRCPEIETAKNMLLEIEKMQKIHINQLKLSIGHKRPCIIIIIPIKCFENISIINSCYSINILSSYFNFIFLRKWMNII